MAHEPMAEGLDRPGRALVKVSVATHAPHRPTPTGSHAPPRPSRPERPAFCGIGVPGFSVGQGTGLTWLCGL